MPIHSLNSYLVSDSTKYSKKKQTYKKKMPQIVISAPQCSLTRNCDSDWVAGLTGDLERWHLRGELNEKTTQLCENTEKSKIGR